MKGTRGPEFLRNVGWIMVVLGGWMVLGNVLMMTGLLSSHGVHTDEWLWAHRPFFYGFNVLFGLVLTWAGWGLIHARETGRKTLMVLALVAIARAAVDILMFAVGSQAHPPERMVMPAAFALGWIIALIFFVQWLNSPRVKAACAEETA
jgi:hypothetical protein